MIILIASQKGGCGKSTIAVNLSAWLANQNRDVVLVDSDRQSTSANWANDRIENVNLKKVNCVQKYDNIRETLLDLAKRYEFVVVDAAGRDSREMRTGLLASDILVVPFRCSQPDLDTLPYMKRVITEALDINQSMRVYGLLTIAPTNPVINEVNESKEYFSDFPELKLLNSVICDRKVYRDVMSYGIGVSELDNEKAIDEINSLAEELLNLKGDYKNIPKFKPQRKGYENA